MKLVSAEESRTADHEVEGSALWISDTDHRARSQDTVLVQQGVHDDPQEECHDYGNEEDRFEQVPGTLGPLLGAAAPPGLAAAVLARCHIAGMYRRRRDAATRRR